MAELTDRQAAFVREYLVDMIATKAAIRAGYSPESARTEGWRLLNNADVAAVIDKTRRERGDRLDVRADDVVKELSRIAFGDITKVVSWNDTTGLTYVPSEDLDNETTPSIAEVSDKTTESKSGTKREQRVKLHDKTRALELLGKHLGMFKADDAGDQATTLLRVIDVLSAGGISMDQIVAHMAANKKPA